MQIFEIEAKIAEIVKQANGGTEFTKFSDHGMITKKLKILAKKIGVDNILAKELWDTEGIENKLLAAMIMEYGNKNHKNLLKCLEETVHWFICDQISAGIINHCSEYKSFLEEYLGNASIIVRRAGYTILKNQVKCKSNIEEVCNYLVRFAMQVNSNNEISNKIETICIDISKLSLDYNNRIIQVLVELNRQYDFNFSSIYNKVLYERVYFLLDNVSDAYILANMKRIGIDTKYAYGVSLTNLRAIAMTLPKNHALAKKFFNSKHHEVRILGTMIDEPKKVTKKQLYELSKKFDSWDICDLTCRNLIEKTRFPKILINEWCYSKDEFVKRAGFVLIARMAVIGNVNDFDKKNYFELIKYGCLDNRNFVKKAVNWALRQLGKMDSDSMNDAKYICHHIKNYGIKSANWIAENALAEFNIINQRNKREENEMNKEEFLEMRDPICLSHYPPLSQTRESIEVIKEMNLEQHNLTNFKNGTIYVHIPFCDEICPFCPFNKFLKDEAKVKKNLEALYKEIEYYSSKQYIQDTQFESVAFGGGTPTCLTSEQLVDLINKIKTSFNFKREIEISIEGNPENYTYEKMKATFGVGVNRISLGIQTFNSDMEGVLKLHHTIAQGIDAINAAHELGCNNVGIDLIYNIPGQTDEELTSDIMKAIDLEVEHVTLFALTTPPQTKLKKDIDIGKIQNIGDKEREIELYQVAERLLIAAGYEQYSVYDFILPNKVNHHALNYFSRQSELVGLGAAAFGYVNGYMYINNGQLDGYENLINKDGMAILYGEKANEKDKMYGMIAKGLRLLKVSKIRFYEEFHKNIEDVFSKEIEFLKAYGLIELDEYNIYLTKTGIIYGNNVCKVFISEDRKEAASMLRNILTKGVKEKEFKG